MPDPRTPEAAAVPAPAADPVRDLQPASADGPAPLGPPTPEPAGWSPGELATLADVAGTLVEDQGDADRLARLAAAALDMAVDPAQVRQLRLALRAFQSRSANLLLAGRPSRFADLDQAAREAYLLGWAGSAVPQRRAAYQGLKRLLTFLAYADPGEAGTNRRLAATGYRYRDDPVAAEPSPIRPLPLVDGAGVVTEPDGSLLLEADVVVVGSGAGGGVVASELARAGRSVVVLEAGSLVTEPEMPIDELAAFDRLYLNHGFNVSWDASILTLAGGAVGGGTTVNWTTCIEPPASVRHRWATEHGVDGFDGPVTDADLAVLDAQLTVGPPPDVPAKDALILRGAEALGWEVAVGRRNAVGCGDCGRCGFGCRAGTKQSGLRVHLADAWRNRARIVPDAPVDRVLTEHGRVVGVEANVALGGKPRRLVVRAPQVVVAAGALRSPIVLIRSGLDHRAIGHHLRLHPVGVVAAILDEDVTMWRGTMQAVRSLHHLGTAIGAGTAGETGSADSGETGGFVVESAPGTPGLAALVFPWQGRDSFARLMGDIRHIAPLIAIVADEGSGRVRLSAAGHPRIDYTLAAVDRPRLRRALAACARIAWAGGAREMVAAATPPVWLRPDRVDGAETGIDAFEARLRDLDVGPNRATVVSAHQMGSLRAGVDADTHPCDPWGRVRTSQARRGADRTVRGLYVGDASLFPTAVGVNPMITTMLWARRVARAVLAEGRPS